MSFGGPGGSNSFFKPTPPDRGSFPLDHDGECKETMTLYMNCLKRVGSAARVPDDCRLRAQDYLNCRMEKGLMKKDDWKNLGLPGYTANTTNASNSAVSTANDTRSTN
ncbi:uncharacterized protein V2V93DRAFT_261556 [Kockiozyma suomiensis]|uniref:uncharacterized protein n=1 Tax=Kockiozyma suomiensis TaxID=1337062 RepID=UPI0033442DAE